MSEEQQDQQSELEREERRLERLRLVVMPRPEPWPEAAEPPVREADRWKGPGGTGRFPQRGPASDPQQAA